MTAQSAPKFWRRLYLSFTTPLLGPFLISTSVAFGLYTVVMLAWAVKTFTPLATPEGVIQAETAICIVAMLFHVGTLLRVVQGDDEFLRAVAFKRIATAAVITLALATIWGLMSNAGWAPQLPLMFLYFGFALVNLATLVFINADRS
jgi:hypothetical protein